MEQVFDFWKIGNRAQCGRTYALDKQLHQSVEAAMTKYHGLCSLNTDIYLLTILRAESPRSSSNRFHILVNVPFLACRQLPFLFVFTWPFLDVCTEREHMRERSLVSLFKRSLILPDEGSVLMISFNLIRSLEVQIQPKQVLGL